MKIKSILFVCMGNICRSPLAEGITRSMSEKNGWNLKIDSAGISSFHRGEAPDSRSIAAAKARNIDISTQKSRPINAQSDKDFDLIIAMDSNNKRDILALGFDKNKVFKLGEFNNGEDVPDPYYDAPDAFNKTYTLIESLLEKMFSKYT